MSAHTRLADDATRLIVAMSWPVHFELDAETRQAISTVIEMACASAVECAPISKDDPIVAMRQIYADARERFFHMARESTLKCSESERALAWSILCAIGEISPDEGMAALERERVRR